MLMSRYDPVQKKVIFGNAAAGVPAAPAGNGITMPDGSVQNYTPSVTPDNSNLSAFSNLPAVAPTPAAAPAAPVGVASNANGGMMRLPLGQYYGQLEQERGLPQGFLAKTRAVESGNGTNLVNPNSSARGDFQFLRGTAKQFGLTDPMDPYASARAAADLAAQNQAGIIKATGQQPTGGELYAAHQQGLGGYLALRGGRGTGSAEMGLNGGAGMSPSGFLAKTIGRFDNAKVANLDGFVPQSPGANQGQGPTVANAAAQGLPTGSVAPAAPAPDNTYKGGLLGLAGIGDQSAPGMGKDVLGKLGDMASQPGGGALGGFAKAIGALAQGQSSGGGGGGITLQANTQAHDANPGFMQYLDPRAKRRAGFLSGG